IIYFTDLGLRNFSIGAFGNLRLSDEFGFVFQNFTANILRMNIENTPWTLHFWRTKDKAEVDFVLTNGSTRIPIEVKYADLKTPEVKPSLRSFIEKYQPQEAWVVNLSLKDEIKIDNTILKFVPFYKLIVQVSDLNYLERANT
ncbi:MAG: DUF4143 domain-containing protein, partial [Parcubacteria group bacterium]|nr:DUF4143 domain-containing protein [Parcubacteria group bacterium]